MFAYIARRVLATIPVMGVVALFVRNGDQGVEVSFSGLGSADDAALLSGVVALLVID